MLRSKEYWVQQLDLQPHPEGGFFKEVYRSPETVKADALPEGFAGERNFSTSIYFLLPGNKFSAFHRIKSDEMWHFYDGNDLTVYYFDHEGHLQTPVLGPDLEKGQSLQVLVPAGAWFASCCNNPGGYSLAGCTVSPGFDFQDFEMARKEELLEQFPNNQEIIHKFALD